MVVNKTWPGLGYQYGKYLLREALYPYFKTKYLK